MLLSIFKIDYEEDEEEELLRLRAHTCVHETKTRGLFSPSVPLRLSVCLPLFRRSIYVL